MMVTYYVADTLLQKLYWNARLRAACWSAFDPER